MGLALLLALGCQQSHRSTRNDGEDLHTYTVDPLTASIFNVRTGTRAIEKTLNCPEFVFRSLSGTVYAKVNGSIKLVLFERWELPPEPGGPLQPGESVCFASFACTQEAFGYQQFIPQYDPPILLPPPKWPELTGVLDVGGVRIAAITAQKTWMPCNLQRRTFSAGPQEIPAFWFNAANLNAEIRPNGIGWWPCNGPATRNTFKDMQVGADNR
jgi:hypothetical protein